MAAARDSEEIAGIRAAVRALCAGFPGEYWRALDRERAYPTEFVDALTEGGISRRADPGRIRRQRAHHVVRHRDHGGDPGRGLQRRRLSRADVHDGHGAASRQRRPEAALSAEDRDRRIAPAGLRRHRADLGHRHARAAHHGGARRQRQLRHQRAEDLDLARRALRPDAAAGAHHAARAGEEAHRGPFGVPGRHEGGGREA